MSVIVKGMDMPRSCKDCRCLCSRWDGEKLLWRCGLNAGMDAERTSVEDVREDCPLVEDSPSDLITEDEYTEMKQTFLRMASYIDSLLICSDEQKETLMNFISQLAEYMPWRKED